MKIPITQFLLPDGRQKRESCEVPDELAEKYRQVQLLGCRITAEVLQNGIVSVCIEHRDGDLYQELCPNGPSDRFPGGPPDAVAKMLRDFDPDAARAMVEQLQ